MFVSYILIGSICPFPWYPSSHDGRFQAKNGNLLSTELEEMCPSGPEEPVGAAPGRHSLMSPWCRALDLPSVLDPTPGLSGPLGLLVLLLACSPSLLQGEVLRAAVLTLNYVAYSLGEHRKLRMPRSFPRPIKAVSLGMYPGNYQDPVISEALWVTPMCSQDGEMLF